jgi:hypothetical protein
MEKVDKISYNPFKKFHEQWGLVTAGTKEKFNSMTISWGSMGTIWGKPMITVFIRPTRYTYEFIKSNEYFTVSFFDEKYRDKLSLMGNKSGRDIDKVKETGFTPKFLDKGITYEEASETFVLKKWYFQFMDASQIPDDVKKVYYTPGDETHYMFIGLVVDKV